MMPPALRAALEERWGPLGRVQQLARGPSATTVWVETRQGALVLKWAVGGPEDAFTAEAAGLRALAAARGASGADLVVPEVLHAAEPEDDAPAHLVLEALETAPRLDGQHGRRLGRALAQLHSAPAGAADYGFARTTYLGGTPQPNATLRDWPAFFRDRRLCPIADRVRLAGGWLPRWDRPWARLLDRLDSLLPHHPAAALVHGDLWSGNALALPDGRVALVDPAAYRGHAEGDLAMTRLFGGFPDSFYVAYEEVCPSEPGAEARERVYSLYHALNHVLLFGAGYHGLVDRYLAGA